MTVQSQNKETKGKVPEAPKPKNMPNDMRAVGNKLVTALGSGKNALQHALTLLESTVQHGDTEIYVSCMTRAKAKGDDNGVSVLRLLITSVWPDGKFANKIPREMSVGKNQKAKPVGHKESYKIKGTKPDLAALKVIRECVADGASLRGSVIRKALKPEKPPLTNEKQLERLDKAVVKIIDESTLSIGAIIAHLQEVQKEMLEAEREAAKESELKKTS